MRTGPTAPRVLAAVVLLAAGPVLRRDARAGVDVLAPPHGAVLASTPAPLIARGSGASLQLNGSPVTPSRAGGGLLASLPLRPGKNQLVVGEGPSRRVIELEYRVGAGAAYRYHAPVAEGDCDGCHPPGGKAPAGGSALCYGCHDRMDGAKFLHGPIGAGQCAVCHDPHGSVRGALLTAGERELCQGCHDQSRTRTHMERSAQKRCVECHDPHGSGTQYLLH